MKCGCKNPKKRITVIVGKRFEVECEVSRQGNKLVVDIKSWKLVAVTFVISTLAYALYHYLVKLVLDFLN